MSRKLAWMAVLVPALWLSTAAALGLGEIEVTSKLNQRFTASIPMTSINMDDTDSIFVTLASNADFERTGIDRTDFLSTLRFKLDTQGGTPRIEITSSQIAREPYIAFLIEVRSGGGRMVREYTVLLDPPSMAEPAPARPAPAASPPRAAAPAPAPAPASAPLPPATTPRSESDFYQTAEEAGKTGESPAPEVSPPPGPPAEAPAAVSGSDTYGPVQPGETFWSIATKLRPGAAQVTMDQMLLSMFEANRQAFDGGINGLRRGAMLKVPAIAEIQSVSATAAKARLAELRGVTAPAPRPAPTAPVVVTPPPEEPVATFSPEPAPAAPPKPARKPEPVPEPKPEPVIAAPEPAPTPPPVEAPAPAPEALVEAAPAPSTETPTSTEAPTAATEPPPATSAESAPTPEPVPETFSAPVMPEKDDGGDAMSLLLPVGGALVLLGGLGFLGYRFYKQRQAAKDAAPVAALRKPVGKSAAASDALAAAKAPPAPQAPAASPPPAPEKPKAPKLPAPQLFTDEVPAPQVKTQQIKTQQVATQMLSTQQMDSTAAATAQLPTFDQTQIFESEIKAAESQIAETGVDFDVTGQFASETVQINLDANDPISEADFHLAYGLYDEAALLLKAAIDKEPGRADLRTKLAETYFAAGKPAEFQEAAESLKPLLGAAEWPKIAIMGQQLCPDAAIFKGVDATAAATDLDFAFDGPSTPVAQPPAIPASHPSGGGGLEFRLEELELPQIEPAPAPSAVDKGQGLEFDIGDFDLNAPASKPAAPSASAAAAPTITARSPPPAPEPERMDLDFSAMGDASSAPTTEVGELSLENFDIGDMPADSTAIAGGDEASTKLDLARAYVDMGDNEMARNLLNEVLQQGSAEQKNEAQSLIARLT